MMVYGLVGGIAAGKSTVSNFLSFRHMPVFDYDLEIHNLYEAKSERGELLYKTILDLLPEAVANCHIDRAYMSNWFFGNPDADIANRINGEIMFHMECAVAEWLAEHRWKTDTRVVILDVPPMYSIGWNRYCDDLIFVDCPLECRIERALARPNMTRDKLDRILELQKDYPAMRARSRFIIDTSGTLEETHDQLETIILDITE